MVLPRSVITEYINGYGRVPTKCAIFVRDF